MRACVRACVRVCVCVCLICSVIISNWLSSVRQKGLETKSKHVFDYIYLDIHMHLFRIFKVRIVELLIVLTFIERVLYRIPKCRNDIELASQSFFKLHFPL